MSKPIDVNEVLNTKYERLTPIQELPPYVWTSSKGKVRSKRMFECRCDCGNIIQCSLEHLRSGHTTSCSCRAKDLASSYSITHGKYSGLGVGDRTLQVWKTLVHRCNSVERYMKLEHSEKLLKDPYYFKYYVEGLDNHGREGYSLDRIDTNKGYIEGNIRYADSYTQCQNQVAKGGSSDYKGVSIHTKQPLKFVSHIRFNGGVYYLGLYHSEYEAALAYARKYKELSGDTRTLEDLVEYFKRK